MKPRLGMTARSGEKCPKSGVWKVGNQFDSTTMSVSRGNKMPLHENKSVVWKLIIMF